MQQPKRVMYVGNKPEKTDTVTHSGLYWPGPGAVLEVDYTIAVQLLRHPDVWVEVDEDGNVINGKSMRSGQSVGKRPQQPAPKAPESPPQDDGDDDGSGETDSDGDGGEGDDTADHCEVTIDAVKEAIQGLDRENPDHFTAVGKPKVKAIEFALARKVTAALVAEAWKEIDG